MSAAELWAGVCLAGGIGALGRMGVDRTVSRRLAGAFPAGTLAVNATGAFVLGLATGLGIGADTAVLLDIGLIGSYTTFSTWMLESHRLAEDGRSALAVWNIAGSAAAGVLLIIAGWALGTLL